MVPDGDPGAAAAVLDTFPGEPLAADLYEPWAAATRERLLFLRASLLRQAGRWEQLLEIDPTNEEAHLALMRAHVRAGDRGAALRQFERMDSVLRRELGVGASPAAAALRRQVLTTMRELGPLSDAEEVRIEQQIRFCRTEDDVTLAYAVTGSGFPLVRAARLADPPGPRLAQQGLGRRRLLDLSRHHQLVRYDERGCGMSDWDIPPPTFEDWLADLETVVDAAGLERFDLLGIFAGWCGVHRVRGPPSRTGSAHRPRWCLREGLAGRRHRGVLSQMHRMFAQSARIGWGRDDPWFRQLFTSRFMPSGSKELWQASNDLQRRTTRPETAVRVFDLCGSLDVSALTPSVSAPTLVLHGRDDQVIPFKTGRRLASLLPDSRFVPLDTDNHILLSDEPAWPVFLAEVEAFLKG